MGEEWLAENQHVAARRGKETAAWLAAHEHMGEEWLAENEHLAAEWFLDYEHSVRIAYTCIHACSAYT